MANPRNLEDFRFNEIHAPQLIFTHRGPEFKVEQSYNTYAIHAFYSTFDDLSNLENLTSSINNGNKTPISISLWYLALEAFINCLVKTCCLKENHDFADLAKQEFGGRISYLIDKLEIDKPTIGPLISKINEFKTFRNTLFHDRNVGKPHTFHKTNFSQIPILSNQVDTFQAMLIFLETSITLRYAIPELDLMANISIGNNSVVFFDRLDVLYKSILLPYFLELLKKHQLTTALDLDIDKLKALTFPKPFFYPAEILSASRIAQLTEYDHPIDKSITNYKAVMYNSVVSSYNKPPNFVGREDFMINWDETYRKYRP